MTAPPAQPKNDVTGSIPARAKGPQLAPMTDQLPLAIGGPQLRSAAAGGDVGAAYEVALRFAEGRGVPMNLTEAARWFERAAGKGLVPAQFRYASMLEKGQGVKKDLPQARRLYLAAAAKGSAKAMHNLAVLYAEGIDGKPDYGIAVKWFQQAAQRGIADSQYNLGVLAARGLGTDKNFTESYKWFALAAAKGDAESAKKRDEVASHLDPQALAAAQQAVKSFVPTPQPEEATAVPKPQGGWDDAKGPAPRPPRLRSSRRRIRDRRRMRPCRSARSPSESSEQARHFGVKRDRARFHRYNRSQAVNCGRASCRSTSRSPTCRSMPSWSWVWGWRSDSFPACSASAAAS